jgi:uncharacterized protein
MENLMCPKCRGVMRTYERSGVTVDQCGECRGIFLDRGELERLVDADTRYDAPRTDEKRYDEKRYDDDRRYSDQHPRKRKKSFFEELFD